MKNIILILFITLSTLKVYSQNYVPFPTSDAFWYEHFFSASSSFSSIIALSGDTVISGSTYHKVTKQQLPFEAENIGAIRENPQKQILFYSYLHSVEFLIYDFSKSTGDTIFFDNAVQYGYLPYIVIENVDSTLIEFSDSSGNSGSEYRKRYITNRVYPLYLNPQIHYSEIWIEGIGSDKGLLTVITDEPTCVCSWGLDNFMHNDSTYYFEHYLYNTISNNSVKPIFHIFPNPSEGKFWINIQTNDQKLNIEVYNLTGEIIRSVKVNSYNKAIDLSNLDKGLYFLKAYNQQSAFIEKVLIK